MDIIYVTPIMYNYFGTTLILFGLVLFFVGFMLSFLVDDGNWVAMVAIIFLLLGYAINSFFDNDYTGYNKYIVKIDDSVTFNEVIKDYDIIKIDRKNNLATLQNKEPKENP